VHHRFLGLVGLLLLVAAVVVYLVLRQTTHRRPNEDEAPMPRSVAPPPSQPGELGSDEGADGAAQVHGSSAPAESQPTEPMPVPISAVTADEREIQPVLSAAWVAATGGEWAVETHGLTKRFGQNTAVDDVELLVPRGCAFGYLGPNGAGKTTLIRTLLGLTKADGGTMALLGVPVPAQRSQALARVGAIVDEPRFHGHLSGRHNLQLLAAARGAGADERIGPALERVGLAGRADDRVSTYSMGMRQRLGVASCLLGDPELLILDEPMNGLDPAGMQEMRHMIQSLVDEGRTVMLSSHLLDEVERTCDAVAIVDRGRVIRQGPIDELIRGAGNVVVRVVCAEPARAAQVVAGQHPGSAVDVAEFGLTVTLPPGSPREAVAALNRSLVSAGISVYGLEEVRATLEDWFLSVTSRLGSDK
jgi:ABC-2 type transport system ATP-binding protein